MPLQDYINSIGNTTLGEIGTYMKTGALRTGFATALGLAAFGLVRQGKELAEDLQRRYETTAVKIAEGRTARKYAADEITKHSEAISEAILARDVFNLVGKGKSADFSINDRFRYVVGSKENGAGNRLLWITIFKNVDNKREAIRKFIDYDSDGLRHSNDIVSLRPNGSSEWEDHKDCKIVQKNHEVYNYLLRDAKKRLEVELEPTKEARLLKDL